MLCRFFVAHSHSMTKMSSSCSSGESWFISSVGKQAFCRHISGGKSGESHQPAGKGITHLEANMCSAGLLCGGCCSWKEMVFYD